VLIPWALVITVACVFVIPRFEFFYRDFGTKLPTMTIYAVQLSHAINSGGWLAMWSFVLVIPFVASRARVDYPGKTLWWRGIVLAVLLCGSTAAVIWFAMQLPMVTIIETVTAGPQK
jgi:type II secretory pathway component PulF